MKSSNNSLEMNRVGGNSPSPSLKRILWTDYPAFLSSLIPIVAWIVYATWAIDWRGQGAVLSARSAPFYLSAAMLSSFLGMGVLIWRVVLLRAIFSNGAQVRGRITSFSLRRDRGQVKYTFIFNHEEHLSGAGVHRNKQTMALKVGNPVILMVDRSNPKRAFIRDLYVDS